MRLFRLDLRAFGSFTDCRPLEFAGGDRGLHLILGPNEAGKSTALRAIRRLLFGFPLQAGDNHRHDYDRMRIGATIRGESGEELSFVRRKKDSAPLWTEDDLRPIAPDSLARFLGGVDQPRFEDLFSMDHPELVRGGAAILGGGGRIGEMLFAAGSGLAGINEVRQSLEAEMNALFKPAGKVLPINAALAELSKARKAARGSILTTSEWVDLDRRIDRARRRLDEVEADRLEAEDARRWLEALSKSLPILRRREEAEAELRRRDGVPVLPEGFAERRWSATEDRERAIKAANAASSALESIAGDIGDLEPPDALLAEADAIGQVQADLGVYLKSRRERPACQRKLADVEADAQALLAEFLPGRSIGDLGAARALASRRSLIQELAQQIGQLGSSCVQAGREVDDLVKALSGTDASPTVGDAGRHARALIEIVDRVTALGDLDGRLAIERSELREAERQADVDLKALRLWSGTIGDLEGLPVPSVSTSDRFEQLLRKADDEVARIKAALDQSKADRIALEREIEAVRLAGPAPTEADLVARRSDRDHAWSLVRSSWLDGLGIEVDRRSIAGRFESASRAADEMADRLRREADRVAEQSRRAADRQAMAGRIEALEVELARAIADLEALSEDWEDQWRSLGARPSPLER